MRFIAMFNLDNDAFTDDQPRAVADVLRDIANRVESGSIAPPAAGMKTSYATVYDLNGNNIGAATYADDSYYIAEQQHPGFRRDWRSR